VVRTNFVSGVSLAIASLASGCYQGLDAHAGGGEAGGSAASSGDGADAGEVGGDSDGDETVVLVEPLHRLNQLEYDNTVRDLLGTTLTPAQGFPPDPATDGFDNVAEGLTLAPQLMDLYASAARDVANDALVIRPRYAIQIGARARAEETGQGGNAFDWGWSLPRGGGSGTLSFEITLPQAEDVTIAILAGGDAVGRPTPEMGVQIDGVEVGHWVVGTPPTSPGVYTTTTSIAAGPHTAVITFPNGDDQPADNVFNSLVVGYLDIESAALFTPPGRAMLYTCEPSQQLDPRPCYHDIVTRFAARAWRRPLTSDEAASIVELWEELAVRETGDDAVLLVVRALLMSSKFLYRASLPAADDVDGDLVPLDDYVLASRLSYFLWSSMPDQLLFDAAAGGHLRSAGGIRSQVRRMLADPKSAGLRKGFAAQWLSTRSFARHQPDPTMFPSFDEPLRAAMIDEAELFFADILGNGLPIGEMMTPDFGFTNDRLAMHYGTPAPGSAEMTMVPVEDDDRRGLLQQGAWLVASSASTRTSPVVRGRWILDELLCTPVPPPPPDVPPLEPPEPGQTVRETLAKHRENKVCATCHDKLDPAGLGMEGFDPVGVVRTLDNGVPIDQSGAIPPGTTFVGAAELASLLADDPRFVACLTQKLYGYALGRGVKPDDLDLLADIGEALEGEGGSLDRLVELIAISPAFRMRPREVQ
jgi:hypothetical protein